MKVIVRLMDRTDPRNVECVGEFQADYLTAGGEEVIAANGEPAEIRNLTDISPAPDWIHRGHRFTHIEIHQEGTE